MTINKSLTVLAVLAVAAFSRSYGWSLKQSNKTHVQVCVVDEERKPVEGVEVGFAFDSGHGRVRKCVTDKDGMISFRDNIGDYAGCELMTDRKTYYHVSFDFHASQSGSVVTGVVKRIVKGPHMVRMCFNRSISNGMHRVGVDLLCGELLPPLGKGRYADIYFVDQQFCGDTVGEDAGWHRFYADYWVERGDSLSEFTIVDKDIGCEFPMPTYAPEIMDSRCDRKFSVDYRPNKCGYSPIGKEKRIIVKLVRPQGVFYGAILDIQFMMDKKASRYDVMFELNPHPYDRCIAGCGDSFYTAAWLDYLRKMYAEEDAEKERAAKEAGRPRKKADAEVVARNRRMMEERAYSGKWECRAWGLESVSLSFDKCGLGQFKTIAENGIFLQYVTEGWFHWTADGNGAITARAVDSSDGVNQGMHELRLKYDFERNVMVPDLKCGLFAGRVFPRADNLTCEMAYAGDVDLISAAHEYSKYTRWLGQEVTEEDALIKAAPKSRVASLDALCDLAKEKCRGTTVLVVRGNGAPEIKIGTNDRCILADIMFKRERGGDAGAPKFKCLAGGYGPEIAENAGPEEFLDPFELDKRVESLGGETERSFVNEAGAWTYERRRYVKVFVEPGKWGKCKEVLKPIMDKWYKFPVEVREVDFAKRK